MPKTFRPAWAEASQLLRDYYDHEWGFPVTDEAELYERIVLEGFQAGLSWATILKRRPAFRAAFDGFAPDLVAAYGESDVSRLLQDATIIRNEAKIRSAINNARATLRLRSSGGLSQLIWAHRPTEQRPVVDPADLPTQSHESRALAAALKNAGFTYIGPISAYALLEAIGVIDNRIRLAVRE